MEKKKRITWADLCKGILITLLMFSHLVWVSKDFYFIENSAINSLGLISSIWNCFFMSCFFIVSGMFSNFNKPFTQFIWGNFKALIIPALVSLVLLNIYKFPNIDYEMVIRSAFLYGGGYWFLCSLFLAKIVLWFFVKWKWNSWIVILLLLIMSFTGKLLDQIGDYSNIWYHRNFLNFTLFLGFGYYFKETIQNKVFGIVSTLVFVTAIVFFFTLGINIPNVVSVYNESLIQHPLTILLSITGSVSIIHLCMLIKHNTVMEYLGKNSLIVYIYHMTFLSLAVAAVEGTLCQTSMRNSIVIVFMILASTLVLCSILAAIINTKYFKWMKGSF